MRRRAYPSDITDEGQPLAAPYLTLMTEDAPRRQDGDARHARHLDLPPEETKWIHKTVGSRQMAVGSALRVTDVERLEAVS